MLHRPLVVFEVVHPELRLSGRCLNQPPEGTFNPSPLQKSQILLPSSVNLDCGCQSERGCCVSHRLPSGDIAPDHFPSPEEARRQVAAPAGWLCLGATTTTRRERVFAPLPSFRRLCWENSHRWRLRSSPPSRLPRTPGSCSPAGS